MIYGDNIIKGRANNIQCDGLSDITDLPSFAETWKLKPMSTCLCAEDSSVYTMKSDGTWSKL